MSETKTDRSVEQVAKELDVLDQLMKPEVQKSLTELVDNLPKLAEMAALLTKAYDVAKVVSTDQVLIDDLKGGLEGVVKPMTEKAKGLASAAVEASDRAQVETPPIGLFGMLKMLKDPQVQKMLRFFQAFLEINAERSKK